MSWRKSSYSGPSACVEFDGQWQASSHCSASECVEVAGRQAMVAMRDSKNPDGHVLTFTPAAWRSFLHGVRR